MKKTPTIPPAVDERTSIFTGGPHRGRIITENSND